MLTIRTILHPTDFSEYSQYAFQLAAALARDHGAHLVVLHVGITPIVAFGEGVLPVDTGALEQELGEKLAQIQAADPQVKVEHRLIMGPEPVAEILQTAAEEPCELIVMGTHGRTGLRRALMGSVAEQIVRKAPCPVLTVKMPFPVAVSAPTAEPAVASGAGI
jgi:nucleotide-binding universal stress UspA family protein